jgi:hypothetical protein
MAMPTMSDPAPEQMAEWAQSKGQVVRVLFDEGGENGFSLVWSWFGPHFPLTRHSHSENCLYYVVRGEAHLGNRVVKAGSGFFLPANAPYAYSAGPERIEILEFRDRNQFDMRITESAAGWDKVVDVVRETRDTWAEQVTTYE